MTTLRFAFHHDLDAFKQERIRYEESLLEQINGAKPSLARLAASELLQWCSMCGLRSKKAQEQMHVATMALISLVANASMEFGRDPRSWVEPIKFFRANYNKSGRPPKGYGGERLKTKLNVSPLSVHEAMSILCTHEGEPLAPEYWPKTMGTVEAGLIAGIKKVNPGCSEDEIRSFVHASLPSWPWDEVRREFRYPVGLRFKKIRVKPYTY